MSSLNVWDANLYDTKLGFVSNLGKEVVKWLNPQRGEKILDLGCGTGDLTFEISKFGVDVIGIDLSSAMIEKAKVKYPNINFSIGNGESFRLNEQFDAVFSNAALHWMKEASKVAESVALALRHGGRFVAEFGGQGNVESIIRGITDVLNEHGVDVRARNPWYFPSIGEYCSLLEKYGFQVCYASHFDRPTPLEDKDAGLNHWLDSFSDDFFPEFNQGQRLKLYDKIKEQTRASLYSEGRWVADYKRIRIVAVKVRS